MRRPVLAGHHDARTVPQLSLEQISAEKSTGACLVGDRLVEHRLRPYRHIGVGIDLSMGVVKCHPHFLSSVLEAEHVLDSSELGQLACSVNPSLDDRPGPPRRQRGEASIMVAGEADHLTSATSGSAGKTGGPQSHLGPWPAKRRTGTGSRTPPRCSRMQAPRRAPLRHGSGTEDTHRPAAGKCGPADDWRSPPTPPSAGRGASCPILPGRHVGAGQQSPSGPALGSSSKYMSSRPSANKVEMRRMLPVSNTDMVMVRLRRADVDGVAFELPGSRQARCLEHSTEP